MGQAVLASPRSNRVHQDLADCNTHSSQCKQGLFRPILLLVASDPRNPHRKLMIQCILFFLGRLHSQGIFYLRRGPQPDTRPGHDADAEQGPGFGG